MFDKQIQKIQTAFKVTKSEIYVTFIVLLGLLGGSISSFFQDQHSKNILTTEFINKIDSLEKIEEVNKADLMKSFYDYKPRKLVSSSIANNDSLANQNDSLISPNNPKKNKISEDLPETINLNNASKSQLMLLPGVGDKTADKIIEYRKEHKFNSISEIMNIKGIGPAKFKKMKEFLIVK